MAIEHTLDAINTGAGPRRRDGSGTIATEGTPEDIAKTDASHTGRFARGFDATTAEGAGEGGRGGEAAGAE